MSDYTNEGVALCLLLTSKNYDDETFRLYFKYLWADQQAKNCILSFLDACQESSCDNDNEDQVFEKVKEVVRDHDGSCSASEYLEDYVDGKVKSLGHAQSGWQAAKTLGTRFAISQGLTLLASSAEFSHTTPSGSVVRLNDGVLKYERGGGDFVSIDIKKFNLGLLNVPRSPSEPKNP